MSASAVFLVLVGSSWTAGAADSSRESLCERYGGLPAADDKKRGMARIPGGHFAMGSNDYYAQEAVTHDVTVDAFWIDRRDVTNAQFARFVASTGYRTLAERCPDLTRHPDLPAEMRMPGAVVFVMPEGGRAGYWRYVAGADWRHPQGPSSSTERRADHPVVQVAYEDAAAYARWSGRDLPTEAQWEFAARGARPGQTYVWGNEFTPHGKSMANTWQGPFPLVDTGDDGHRGTSPVGCSPANGHGLYDMAGNVWQWTSTWYRPGHDRHAEDNPAGPNELETYDPRQPGTPAKVIKGGSHLCAPNYSLRYRPAARQARETDSGTSHIGFRTVLNENRPSQANGITSGSVASGQ